MKNKMPGGAICAVMTCLACALSVPAGRTDTVDPADPQIPAGLWARDNLVAWCAVPFDSRARAPEERALMLERLGFRSFAYDWREKDVPTFDREIEALRRHGVNLLAWWFPFDAGDPGARNTLELFRRHNAHPQLWVALPGKEVAMPSNAEGMSPDERHQLSIRLMRQSLPGNPQEQDLRVRRDGERISALVKLAAPYGCRVELYNHNGWFGMMDNEVAIIEYLKGTGVTGVGIVYNFSHARDELQDDTADFPAVWEKIRRHVVAVNITGTAMDGNLIYPSQGDRELQMMRTIQASGWKGPIGLIAEKGGDAEVTLRNYQVGLGWLAAELRQPGSGGARPFPALP